VLIGANDPERACDAISPIDQPGEIATASREHRRHAGSSVSSPKRDASVIGGNGGN